MYCPGTDEEFIMFETTRSENMSYILVTLQLCNVTLNPNCNHTAAQKWLINQTQQLTVAQVWFYVLDKALFGNKKNPWEYYINIDTKIQMTKKLGGYATVEFSTFSIETDMSVLPIASV